MIRHLFFFFNCVKPSKQGQVVYHKDGSMSGLVWALGKEYDERIKVLGTSGKKIYVAITKSSIWLSCDCWRVVKNLENRQFCDYSLISSECEVAVIFEQPVFESQGLFHVYSLQNDSRLCSLFRCPPLLALPQIPLYLPWQPPPYLGFNLLGYIFK